MFGVTYCRRARTRAESDGYELPLVRTNVFFLSNSHTSNAFFPIIFHRFIRGLSSKVAIAKISLLVMPETHFPRITLSRQLRSRGPVPSRAIYPGFSVLAVQKVLYYGCGRAIGSAVWGNTLATALLHDKNWTIPFGLIALV